MKESKVYNQQLAEQLSKACAYSNRIKLPTSIQFALEGNVVRMHLSSACLRANMQNDSSSFEGWALAIKRWLKDVEHIKLCWDYDGEDDSLHYQRFLFRAKEFKSIFPSWFSIDPSNTAEFSILKTKMAGKYVITASKIVRTTSEKYKNADDISKALQSEHELECFIKDHPSDLMALCRLDRLDRQFPVGVFSNQVNRGNEIFPSRHSAIDLWGVSGKQLVLFELKKSGNNPIGILSEMFFYSFVMEAIQKNRFSLKKESALITQTESVYTYILAPSWHPLIDLGVISMVNQMFAANHRRIRFGIIQIEHGNAPAFALKTPDNTPF